MAHDLTKTWDLVHKAQAGDGDALDRLFARYYERVRRAVRPRLGPHLRSRLETVDILQPAFAKAFQNFDRFEMRNEGSLLHWLAEYAKGQLLDAADRENAQKRRASADQVDLDAARDGSRTIELPAPAPPPPEVAEQREVEAAMEQCLDELPEHYRMVVVLRDYDELEWLEIATKMGKHTDSAARELHSRAKEALAARLRLRGFGPDLAR